MYRYAGDAPGVHGAFLRLGQWLRTGAIYDDDERAAALVFAFESLVRDYITPPNKSLTWDLDKHVKNQVSYSHA